MAWTEERVTKLQELWAEGLTASQIAKALGSVSRNAVIGKVHRLGLSNRTTGAKPGEADGEEPIELKKKETVATTATETTKPAAAPTATAAPAAQQPESKAPAPVAAVEASETDVASPAESVATPSMGVEPNPIALLAAEAEKNARKLSLLELNERTCKWPIGDPSTSDFYFCGLQAAPEKPYCAAHNAVAYQPMSSRRDRDRSRSPNPPRAVSA